MRLRKTIVSETFILWSTDHCVSVMTAPMLPREIGAVSLFMQGRWWCAPCKVLWQGTWAVPDIAPHVLQGEEWAPIHDCGVVMVRTSGDERADA